MPREYPFIIIGFSCVNLILTIFYEFLMVPAMIRGYNHFILNNKSKN